MWPAHGTVFSHVVSDTSLAELHAFAARTGLPPQAFDRDHYDVPARRYDDLVTQGARPVGARELVRRLRASGLRVRSKERADRLEVSLLIRWRALIPRHEQLGRELLGLWSEAPRHYHDATHLLACLDALDVLTAPERPPREVALAAWFHDAVYAGVAGQDEQHSADLARDRLAGAELPGEAIAEVVRLVLLTATHSPAASDRNGGLLCDADLSVLGREPRGYARYLAAVRQDYAHVSDADFTLGRSLVVRRLLDLDPLFHTERAASLWGNTARRNLAGELGPPEGAPHHEHRTYHGPEG